MTISSVEKAMEILKAFASNQTYELGNLELSQKLGYPTSTVNRLLRLLASYDFLEKNHTTKKYLLGRSAADLGKAISRRLSSTLVNLSIPHINQLRDLTGESAGFEVMYGKSTVLVYEAKSPNPVSVFFGVGDTMPCHASAGAKAIMAFLSSDNTDQLLAGNLDQATKKTIVDRNLIKSEMAKIRKQGVGFDFDGVTDGVSAIGVPVFNHKEEPIAAVCVAAPSFRMDDQMIERIVPLAKETARKISEKLFATDKGLNQET